MGPLAPCIKKAKDEHSPREYIAKVQLKHPWNFPSFPCFVLFYFSLFWTKAQKYKAIQ